MWLIGWRVLQAVGGSMLTANSAAMLSGGLVLLAAFVVIESRVTAPMIQLGLFRLRAFTAGNIAGLAISIGRPC